MSFKLLEKIKSLNKKGIFLTQSQRRKYKREKLLHLQKLKFKPTKQIFHLDKQNNNFKFQKMKKIQISFDQITSKYDENKFLKLQDCDSYMIELKQNINESLKQNNIFAKEKILYISKNFKNFKKNFIKRRNSCYCKNCGNSNKLQNTDQLQIDKEIKNNLNNILNQDKQFQQVLNTQIKKLERKEKHKRNSADNQQKKQDQNEKKTLTVKFDKKYNQINEKQFLVLNQYQEKQIKFDKTLFSKKSQKVNEINSFLKQSTMRKSQFSKKNDDNLISNFDDSMKKKEEFLSKLKQSSMRNSTSRVLQKVKVINQFKNSVDKQIIESQQNQTPKNKFRIKNYNISTSVSNKSLDVSKFPLFRENKKIIQFMQYNNHY